MYKFIFSFLCVFLVGMILPSQAQISLNSSGDVSIDETLKIGNPTISSSIYKVAIECGTSCGNVWSSFGMHVTSNSNTTGSQYGILGKAVNSTDANNNYGVKGSASGGSYLNRGIVGSASGSSSYGGYFTGGLYVSGGITHGSDARLKTNIQELNRTDIYSKIQTLWPLKYEFQGAEELRSRGLPASLSDEGEHFGLLAQELEGIFPELVSEVVQVLDEDMSPEQKAESKPELVTTKAINYQELTVVLLAAVQELQGKVEALEKALKQKLID